MDKQKRPWCLNILNTSAVIIRSIQDNPYCKFFVMVSILFQNGSSLKGKIVQNKWVVQHESQ